MFVGIDIGAHKTVIFSTAGGGKIVNDEQGKREISTVLELCEKSRSFGNHVSGDPGIGYIGRFRALIGDLKNPAAQERLYMFLCYLHRVINVGCTSASLAIPECLDETERTILYQLVKASPLSVGCFISQLTSAATCAIYYSSPPENFVIVDFGHMKTSVGLFQFKDAKLVPKKRFSIRKGSLDIERAISDFLYSKYNLKSCPVVDEGVYNSLSKIKKGFNCLSEVTVVINDEKYCPKELKMTKDDFVSCSSRTFTEIKKFIDDCFTDPEIKAASSVCTEVIGSNSNSKFITDIMAPYNSTRRMQSTDVVAKGACLAYYFNAIDKRYRIEEIAGREIHLRVKEDGSAPVCIIKPEDIVGNVVSVRYNRSSSFEIEVYDAGQPVGIIRVKVPEIKKDGAGSPADGDHSSDAEPVVKVGIVVGCYNTVEVRSAALYTQDQQQAMPLDFEYTGPGLSEERIQAIVEAEERFAKAEREMHLLDSFRHEAENFFGALEVNLDSIFPGLLTAEDRALIGDVAEEYFRIRCDTLDEEKEKKAKAVEKLISIDAKLRKAEEAVRAQVLEIRAKVEPYVVATKDMTMEQIEYSRLDAGLDFFLKQLKIDIQNFINFDSRRIQKFRQDLKKVEEMRASREAELKRQEEAKAKKAAEHPPEDQKVDTQGYESEHDRDSGKESEEGSSQKETSEVAPSETQKATDADTSRAEL